MKCGNYLGFSPPGAGASAGAFSPAGTAASAGAFSPAGAVTGGLVSFFSTFFAWQPTAQNRPKLKIITKATNFFMDSPFQKHL